MKPVRSPRLSLALRPYQLLPPKWSLSVIAKGTYRLVRDAVALPIESEDPEMPLGDLHEDDDPSKPLAYASDFVPFKPRADLLLRATAYAPGGRPVTTLPVSFSVGATSHELVVFGDRYWTDRSRNSSSAPSPFTEMAIGYERAFGGAGFGLNPCGRGVYPLTEEDPLNLRLPNIEDPLDLISTFEDRPLPASFRPLAATWTQRATQLGSYDERWLRTRWPFLPEDFDLGHFNAAPRALQTAYLTGNEQIVCKNLHPEHVEYRAKLPGIRVRCFLDEKAGAREVEMHLDTMEVDLEDESLMLVWRGVAEVSAEAFPEVEDVVIVQERLDEPPLSVDHYQQVFALEKTSAEAKPVSAEAAPKNDNAGGTDHTTSEDVAFLEELKSHLAKAGAPGALVAAIGTDGATKELEELLAKYPGDPAKAEERERKRREQVKEAMKAEGHDPSVLDEMEADTGDRLEEEDPSTAPWTRQRVEVCLAAKVSMAAAKLSGLDLSELDFSGACLSHARLDSTELTGCSFAEADLEHANLSAACLKGAWLTKAKLRGANLTNANLEDADLTAAVLTRATLDRARLTSAILDDVDAEQSSFVEADLVGARCHRSKLGKARLARSTLHNVSFRGASLVNAVLEGAVGGDLDFLEADLSLVRAEGARLPRLKARGTLVEGGRFGDAQLAGADFALARMKKVDLHGANLEGADLRGADLAGADLTAARLLGIRGAHANLAGSRLERADLQNADLRHAELFEAALWQARLKGSDLTHAHVDGTLLTSDRGAP